MVGLQDARAAGGGGQAPGPEPEGPAQEGGERHVEHDVAAIVAQAVDDLAIGRGLAGAPGQLAVGPVQHVPGAVEQKADQGRRRPGDQRIGEAGRRDGRRARYRHRVGRDEGRLQEPGDRARGRMDQAGVPPLLDLQRPRGIGLGARAGPVGSEVMGAAGRRTRRLGSQEAGLSAQPLPDGGRRQARRGPCARRRPRWRRGRGRSGGRRAPLRPGCRASGRPPLR